MIRRVLSVALLVGLLGATGCSSDSPDSDGARPGPLKVDGSRSDQFEADDFEAADDASDAVKYYCSGAVSEAQRLGCEANVTDGDIP